MGSNIDQGLGPKLERQVTLTVSIGREEYEGGGAKALAVFGPQFYTTKFNLPTTLRDLNPKLDNQRKPYGKSTATRELPQSWTARVYDFLD